MHLMIIFDISAYGIYGCQIGSFYCFEKVQQHLHFRCVCSFDYKVASGSVVVVRTL